MRVGPEFALKPIFKTEAGELIRLLWGQPELALVVFSGTTRILIILNKVFNGQAGPVYLVPNAEEDVISYGTNNFVHLSHDPNYIDLKRNKYHSVPGAIFASPDQRRLLYASALKGGGSMGGFFFDLATGHIVEGVEVHKGFYFGKWDIYVGEGEPRLDIDKPIFSFVLP
jgi:hypothetical protein